MPGGIPSHDSFGKVFSRLDPGQCQSRFMGWTQEVARLAQGEVVAIDGKTVRRSHDRNSGKQAIHLVSAWASANTMTLGQVKTGEKSNEITAIPRLLELLALQGCIVTIDAMGCQREIAEQIVEGGADYVLAVKDNQSQLYDDVRDLFQGAEEYGFEGVPHDYAQTLNKGHGRIERRECWVISDSECLDCLGTKAQWFGLKAAEEGATVHSRYNISSLEAPAGKMLEAVRSHWSIENSLRGGRDAVRNQIDRAADRLAPGVPGRAARRAAAERPRHAGRGPDDINGRQRERDHGRRRGRRGNVNQQLPCRRLWLYHAGHGRRHDDARGRHVGHRSGGRGYWRRRPPGRPVQ